MDLDCSLPLGKDLLLSRSGENVPHGLGLEFYAVLSNDFVFCLLLSIYFINTLNTRNEYFSETI